MRPYNEDEKWKFVMEHSIKPYEKKSKRGNTPCCPNCNSTNISYSSNEEIDGMYIPGYYCYNCHRSFVESLVKYR